MGGGGWWVLDFTILMLSQLQLKLELKFKLSLAIIYLEFCNNLTYKNREGPSFIFILVFIIFQNYVCLKLLMFITGKSAVLISSINHQILASHFITLHVIQICFI